MFNLDTDDDDDQALIFKKVQTLGANVQTRVIFLFRGTTIFLQLVTSTPN